MNKRELELCKKALCRVEMSELSFFDFLDIQVPNHSREFRNKMNALIEKTRKKEASFLLMNYKKILIAVVVAILLTTTLVGCIFAHKIQDFFIEVFDVGTKFTTDVQINQTTHTIYELSYLPKEYRELYTTVNNGHVMRVFETNEDTISFNQTPIGKSTISIDTEEQAAQTIKIGNLTLHYTSRKEHYIFVWKNEDYVFSLTCPDSILWNEIEQIILGIVPIEV